MTQTQDISLSATPTPPIAEDSPNDTHDKRFCVKIKQIEPNLQEDGVNSNIVAWVQIKDGAGANCDHLSSRPNMASKLKLDASLVKNVANPL